jgi:vacuolar-type H+-ATPase subunit H
MTTVATTDARSSDAADVEAAIAGVLEAERAAGAAVESCAKQAQARVQQARERARAIAERAAQRTAHVRRIAAERLAERLAAIERERLALGEHTDPDTGDLQRLQAAINRLAATLTADERGGSQ